MVIGLSLWGSYFEDFRVELGSVDRCEEAPASLSSHSHWSMTTLSLVLDGPAPNRVILGFGTCDEWLAGDRPLSSGQPQQVGGVEGQLVLDDPGGG